MPPRRHPSQARSRQLFVLSLGLVLLVGLWTLTAEPRADLPLWRRYPPHALVLDAALTYAWTCAAVILLPRGDRSRRARAVLACTGSAALALLLLEAPAVLLGHDWRGTLGLLSDDAFLRRSRALNRPDPELLHVHWPGSRFTGRVEGNLCRLGIPPERTYAVDVRYDRNGFRNARDLARADVAVIGDSFVEGALVPLERTVAARVEQLTERVTANLGQAAYGFRQELAVLRRYGLPLEPRVVLWFLFGGNDLRDVDAYEAARARLVRGLRDPPAPLADRLLSRNLPAWLRRVGTRRETSATALAHRGQLRRPDGTTEAIYFGQHEGPWQPRELAVGQETLLAARDACRAHGARLLVAYIPRKFRVYADRCEFAPGTVCASWESNDLPQVLARWCAEQDLAFLDLTPALRARLDEGEHVYFPDDVHWTAAGHDAAARAVVGELRARGWLDPAPAAADDH